MRDGEEVQVWDPYTLKLLATAGAQPERYLLQQPCPRDGAVTCRSTRLSRRLIDRYQHGMPLCAEPYRAMAEELGCSEGEVLACLERFAGGGRAVAYRPGVRAQPRRGQHAGSAGRARGAPEQVAARINAFPEVNHNYLREHRYNLWFVLTGPDRAHIDRLLAEIEADTGLVPLDLPMQQAFRIDLGFPLGDIR